MARLGQEDEDIVNALWQVKLSTPIGHQLLPYSLAQFRQHLKNVEKVLQVDMGWTPHSARAGWASDSRAEGMSFEELRERGRWVSDNSLRTFLDIVGASSILRQLQM